MEKLVLIVEDEKPIVDILEFHLRRSGYETAVAMDGEKGLDMAKELKPDMILLDVMLPRLDGFSVCRALREADLWMPILMLTARDNEDDRVTGLELGADDYITKPFYMKELLARVGANLRRSGAGAEPAAESEAPAEIIESGLLKLHTGRMELTIDGTAVELSQREYDLLLYLMRHSGVVVSRDELMREVWNYDYMGDLRVVDVAVRRLREKIEPTPADPSYILTKRGVGYFLAHPVDRP